MSFHSRAGSDRAGWPSGVPIRVRECQRPGSRRRIGLAAWAAWMPREGEHDNA